MAMPPAKAGKTLSCVTCGQDFYAKPSEIKRGRKACTYECAKPLIGANKREDLSGRKFGRLTAIEVVQNKYSYSKVCWRCVCDCGNETVVTSGCLKRKGNKAVRSCGCLRNQNYPRINGNEYQARTWRKKIPENVVSLTYISNIRLGAKYRGLRFDLTREYLQKLYDSQEGRCRFTGTPIHFRGGKASLDRIDSDVGYIEGNVQWVHATINNMKWTLTDEDFIEMCRKVTDYARR